jgi:hypothetical protein
MDNIRSADYAAGERRNEAKKDQFFTSTIRSISTVELVEVLRKLPISYEDKFNTLRWVLDHKNTRTRINVSEVIKAKSVILKRLIKPNVCNNSKSISNESEVLALIDDIAGVNNQDRSQNDIINDIIAEFEYDIDDSKARDMIRKLKNQITK